MKEKKRKSRREKRTAEKENENIFFRLSKRKNMKNLNWILLFLSLTTKRNNDLIVINDDFY